MEPQKKNSAENLLRNYTKKNTSNRHGYLSNNEENSSKTGIGFWIFLGIAFLLAYYIFSTFVFTPNL